MTTKPTTTDAEKYVLGAAFVGTKQAVDRIIECGLSLEWFADAYHRQVWECVVELWTENAPIEDVTIADLMSKRGHAFALEFWIECADKCTTVEHVEHYVSMVRDAYMFRRMAVTGTALQRRAVAHDAGSAAELAAWAQEELGHFGDSKRKERHIASICMDVLDTWQAGKTITGLRYPLRSMADNIPDITTEYIMLAAHPSTGKTAFIVQMAVSNAMRNIPIAIASLESSAEKLSERFIAHHAQVNTLAMRRGVSSKFDQARERVKDMERLPIHVTDEPMNDVQLEAWARSKQALGARLLIVDNLRSLQSSRKYESEPVKYADLSMRLKLIRDKLRMPVLALHHLNEQDNVGWSRDITKDVDDLWIMTEDKDESIPPSTGNPCGKSIVVFKSAKCRDGLRNVEYRAEFVKEYQTFVDVSGYGQRGELP